MVWNVFFVFMFSACLGSSLEDYYELSRRFSVLGYPIPLIRQRVPVQRRETPVEAMADLTNNLGVAILRDHLFCRGNFAFSPYGVASVLVILYEGAKGQSAEQIHEAVKFPRDKDMIRLGFRDIHQHLRSYFSHEGYLSGISLNKESFCLKSEYTNFLRYYGYDIDLNQTCIEKHDDDFENNSSKASSPITSVPSEVSTDKVSAVTSLIHNSNKTTTTSQHSEKESTKKAEPTSVTEPSSHPLSTEAQQSKETTAATLQATVTVSPNQDLTELPNMNEETQKTLETETVKSTTEYSTAKTQINELQTTFSSENNLSCQEEAENNEKQSAKECEKEKNNKMGETEQSKDVSSTVAEDQETYTWDSSNLPVTESETETTKNDKTEEITNVSIDNGMLIPQSDDLRTTTTEKSPTTTEVYFSTLDVTASDLTETTTENAEITTVPIQSKDSLSKEGNRTQERYGISPLKGEKKNDKFIKHIRNIVDTKLSLWLTEKKKKPTSRKTRTITDYLKSPHSLELSMQLQNGMYDTHVSRNGDFYRSLPSVPFLVDGTIDMPVPMMSCTNVFSYAYVPQLNSKALKFPLDDVRYKLLILLPVGRTGLRQLIYDLKDFPLRNVLKCLRPARVRAMIPAFMMEGFVVLTSSLQKLGIRDVFDPHKANLSGMSMDPELYVRNVEQSVTVVIRNYVEILDIQTPTMPVRHIDYEFYATHPFLYFVLDEVTNVALMAGQLWDPLNSRIY